ncbi:hypothetical protein ABIE56_003704 [Luteibacter sp. 621]|uniref:SMI1/KNR4 family protein n=1 Tax=Luteibacter sp. 621 TaxID=3373916 RepID=UPI003D20D3C6
MLNSIQECVDRIDSHLRDFHRPVMSKLLPGIAKEVIQGALVERALVPSSDLAALYACHGGTDVRPGDGLDNVHYFPGFYWLSLEDALLTHLSFADDRRWSSAWLPIFGNGGGDFFAVDCDGASSTFGAVIGFRLGEVDAPVQFASMGSMMRSVAKCYDLGIYFLSDGYLEADDFKAELVAKEFNPYLSYYAD